MPARHLDFPPPIFFGDQSFDVTALKHVDADRLAVLDRVTVVTAAQNDARRPSPLYHLGNSRPLIFIRNFRPPHQFHQIGTQTFAIDKRHRLGGEAIDTNAVSVFLGKIAGQIETR